LLHFSDRISNIEETSGGAPSTTQAASTSSAIQSSQQSAVASTSSATPTQSARKRRKQDSEDLVEQAIISSLKAPDIDPLGKMVSDAYQTLQSKDLKRAALDFKRDILAAVGKFERVALGDDDS